MKRVGNLRGWSIWSILVLTFATVFFHRLSIGAVADNLVEELKISGALLGNLTAMNFYAYALAQIPVGIMVDTMGVRKICTWGTLITGIGAILFGFATGIRLAYFARFLTGLGTSVVIVSIMKVQIQWFKAEQFSTLSGITSFVANFGGLLASFPLTYLVVRIGWRNSFYVMGGISILLSIVLWVVVKEHPNEARLKERSKGELYQHIKKGLQGVVRNPYTWPPFFLMFFFIGSITAIVGLWGIPYITHVYHIPKEQAAGYISFLSIGFIVGSPFVGKISALLGGEVKKILLLAIGTYSLVWTYMGFMEGKPPIQHLPILFLLMGLAGVFHILAFTNVKEVNDLDFSGSATAIVNVGEFTGGSILSLGIGILLDYRWMGETVGESRIYDAKQYGEIFFIIALMGLMSMVATLLMKDTKEGKKKHNEAREVVV